MRLEPLEAALLVDGAVRGFRVLYASLGHAGDHVAVIDLTLEELSSRGCVRRRAPAS
ncbi:hypothetical protein GCM10010269_83580 [Streptomyces humidus]|uniref:Uncharacterized protein n=1 Tax=Streptomyces humidus TaxID=52259 RepID=A0A918LDF4_9ACTN|nr:hypothetical protein GCM10010269_83580 [Streptomyces humidus]